MHIFSINLVYETIKYVVRPRDLQLNYHQGKGCWVENK
jgi:hypothetical protein